MTSKETIEQSVKEIIERVTEGKPMEAFEKFYDDSLVMQENDGELREGKDANREYENAFISKITNLRAYSCAGYTVGDGISSITWNIDMDHEDMGAAKFSEVAVQFWKDGKIIKERFNYGS